MTRYLIAVDLSPLAADVIQQGCAMAAKMGARVTIAHSVPNLATWRGYEPALPPTMEDEMEKAARCKLESFIELLRSRDAALADVIDDIKIFNGDPAATLTTFAQEEGVNLIIVGHRGQGTLERLLVGSTATSIIKFAETSVLVCRPGIPLC